MIRPVALIALALLVSLPAEAQDPTASARPHTLVGEAPRGNELAPPSRLFEIRDGSLWMDGRELPPEAIPPGIDLSGFVMEMELVGPLTPVVKIDGAPYVLENERLVPFAESADGSNVVYILGETMMAPEAAPEERLAPVVDEAYRRRLSRADQELLAQLETEAVLESEIQLLAVQIRQMPDGDRADALAADLRQRLGTLFDLKQQIRAEELRRAESQLADLRETIKARTALREDIIHHRFLELMGENGER